MSKKTKIIIFSVIAVIVIVVLIISGTLYNLGYFNKVQISTGQAGPYHYVYIDKTGPFSEIPKAQIELDKLIRTRDIKTLESCGQYLDDPSTTTQNQLRWRLGYIIGDSITVDEPLNYRFIAEDYFVIATIKAHPMVAAFKTYPLLEKWIIENNSQIIGPALEIYTSDGFVKSMFPIVKSE